MSDCLPGVSSSAQSDIRHFLFRMLLKVRNSLILLLAAPGIAHAQGRLPDAPSLTGINPPSASRGSTVEVTLTGQRLEGSSGLVCRFSAFPQLIPYEKRGLVAEVVSSTEGQVRARITVPADAPPGTHEIRAITQNGITTPEYFYVAQYPQVPEREPNNVPGQANPIALPATVAGTINGGADQDVYSFPAKKGETLVFEVEGFRRYSPGQNDQEGIVYLDSFLSIRDASGTELAYDDDSVRVDPLLAYRFPADGAYTVTIRDTQYRGRGDFHYRLSIGRGPHITAIFPSGGQAGQSVTATVFGFNLDATGATEVRRLIKLPSAPQTQEFRIVTPAGMSNAVPVVASASPETSETEPNDRPQDGTRFIVPSVCSGKFDRLDDVDCYRFQGQSGQRLVIEVHAARMGSPVDPYITLVSRAGRVISQDDDAAGQSDSRLVVTIPSSEEFAVMVQNQTRIGCGPSFCYRLTVRLPRPDFSAQLQQEGVNRQGGPTNVNVESVAVTKGAETEFDVLVNRREDQGGDITIRTDFPPGVEGITIDQIIKPPRMGNMPSTMPPKIIPIPVIKNGQNRITLRVKAAPTAKPGTYMGGYLRLEGTAAGRPLVVREPFWFTVSP